MPIQKITSGIIQDGAIEAADIVSIANTQITGNIVSSQITSVANTQITGNIVSSQITSVANTQITGNIAATTATTATTATNLAGGSNGTIPYQSASGTTAMLAAGTSGQYLKSTGASAPSWDTPSGGFSTLVVLTTSQTYTIPAGVTKMKIYVIGAGGGPNNTGTYAGGGGGGTAIKYLTVTPASTAAVTIGSGGGVTTAGGDTTFVYNATTYTGGGGRGGNTVVSSGIATGGDLNVPGSYGGYLNSAENSGGFGGMSIFPGGGQQGNSSGSQNGFFYGGGGACHPSVGNGTGYQGAVIIEY